MIITPRNSQNLEEMKDFSVKCARVCYSELDWEQIKNEPPNPKLEKRLIESGHHSPFGHAHVSFDFKGIAKILAMILNGERLNNTSEKSARYTQMQKIPEEQKRFYDKWMNKLIPEIDKILPKRNQPEKDRILAVKKLAQENARYMTSVFTPTKMIHTLDLRQLNYIMDMFETFAEENRDDDFKKRVSVFMKDFNEQMQEFKIEGLVPHNGQKLNFFRDSQVEEHFGDSYSTNYKVSFAGLAQLHRHRILTYQISGGTELGAPEGFFVPEFIRETDLEKQWIADLEEIAKTDFPQAQLIIVNEMGTAEGFAMKYSERVCGHAQNEAMRRTYETGRKYAKARPDLADLVFPRNPSCVTNPRKKCTCLWGAGNATTRTA